MKTCIKCGMEKDETDFFFKNKPKQIRSTKCSSCSMEYSKNHYKENKSKYITRAKRFNKNQVVENRQKMIDFLVGKRCKDCGNEDVRVLEFDHKNRVDKTDNVSSMLYRYSWKRILKEIQKCDIRCANCHRIRTGIQLGSFRNIFLILSSLWTIY